MNATTQRSTSRTLFALLATAVTALVLALSLGAPAEAHAASADRADVMASWDAPSSGLGSTLAALELADAAPAAEQNQKQPAASGEAGSDGWESNMRSLVSQRALAIGGRIALALGLFIVGWIVAKMLSYAVYTLLSKTDFDNKLAERLGISMLLKDRKGSGEGGDVERFLAKVVYYLVMLLVVVGVLQFAGLSQVAGPLERLVDTVMQALPRLAKAAIIILVAYVAGRILSMIVTRALDGVGVDERFAKLSDSEQSDGTPFSSGAGKVVFWLLIVIGLAGAFEALEIEPIAGPMHNALDRIIGLLPRVAVAALIVFVGWILGKILRTVIKNLLSGVGFDKAMAKLGLDKFTGKSTWSDLVGMVVQIFVMLQATIAALGELGLTTLSEPLTGMIGQVWGMLPAIAVSAVIILVGVFVGGLLRSLVANGLRNVGFDSLMERIGFGKLSEREDRLGEFSELVAYGVQIGVILLAVAQALDNLALDTWSVYVNTFLAYLLKNVAVALVVVLVGFIIGRYVRDLIVARAGDDAANETQRWIGEFARYAVLVFAFTMAVRQLDVAEDFVLMTFGLLFGALCLAIALAFGLGSREVAGDIVKRRYDDAKKRLARSGGTRPAGGGLAGGLGGGASRPAGGGTGGAAPGGTTPPAGGTTPPAGG